MSPSELPEKLKRSSDARKSLATRVFEEVKTEFNGWLQEEATRTLQSIGETSIYPWRIQKPDTEVSELATDFTRSAALNSPVEEANLAEPCEHMSYQVKGADGTLESVIVPTYQLEEVKPG